MKTLYSKPRASLFVEMTFSTLPLVFIFMVTTQFILQSQDRVRQATELQTKLQEAHLNKNSGQQKFKYKFSSNLDHNSLSADWLKNQKDRKSFEFYNDTNVEWDFQSGGMLDYDTWLIQMKNFFSF